MIFLAGSIDLLNVNPGLAIWTFVTFSVVLFVLWKLAWKPIIDSLDKRNQKVVDDLEESKSLREKAEKLLQEYENKLNSAKQQSIEIIEEAQKDADDIKNRMLQEAEEEANNIKNRVEKEMEYSKQKTLDNIQSTILNLSVELVSNILKNKLDSQKHLQLIQEEIKTLDKSQ